MKLYCATKNRGKLREFQNVAGDIEIAVLPDLDKLPAPDENGGTFEANARLKAEYYSREADCPVFADDSGLVVDALGEEPGVYSARYAGEGAGDAANNRLLLERMQGIEDRRARFKCVIALAEKGHVIATFSGAVAGQILSEPRGTNGFGYDPLFYYAPLGCTMAEIETARKFDISHRGEALRKMFAYLRSRAR
ncbi:MAG: RdgB/HAM1 family non-canonical purine NTP pyrophosphatase [Bryobacterales bacterium]|nr:RdgB/HAM1 family non-canonical purine NTP pyrophosphatase [Bryobacterales bacterium]